MSVALSLPIAGDRLSFLSPVVPTVEMPMWCGDQLFMVRTANDKGQVSVTARLANDPATELETSITSERLAGAISFALQTLVESAVRDLADYFEDSLLAIAA